MNGGSVLLANRFIWLTAFTKIFAISGPVAFFARKTSTLAL